jgi:DNA polymerase III delta prime subunit
VSRNYIDWILDLPWLDSTKDTLDLSRRRRDLNQDHYGLKKIKKRILEFLAVRKLKEDIHGPILCFVGPPGVGKTSLGQSIARTMNRKFVRIALGGVRDEAEIRGHRRTYIGACRVGSSRASNGPGPTTRSSCSTRSTNWATISAAIPARPCSRFSIRSRTRPSPTITSISNSISPR